MFQFNSADTISGNVSGFSDGSVRSLGMINRFDVNPFPSPPGSPHCSVPTNQGLAFNPVGGSGDFAYNASPKFVSVVSMTSGANHVVGDYCGGRGYKWNVDLFMQFDIDVQFIHQTGVSVNDEVRIGFTSMGGGTPNMVGPWIGFTSTPYPLSIPRWRLGSTNGSDLLGTYQTGLSNDTWYHVTLAYDGDTQVSRAEVSGLGYDIVATLGGTTWDVPFLASGYGIDGTGIQTTSLIVGPPPLLSVHIDNMTMDGYGAGAWTGQMQSNFPIHFAYLNYRAPKDLTGATPGQLCRDCYANLSVGVNAWQGRFAAPGSNATVVLNITSALRGSWANVTTSWSFTALIRGNGSASVGQVELVSVVYVYGATTWINPTPSPENAAFDWIVPLVAIVGIGIMVAVTVSLGIDFFKQ